MIPLRHRFGGAALALLGALTAAPLTAQSPLARSGLGLPVEPLDARSVALGGVGLGLRGIELSLVNPAAIALLPAPALGGTFQFTAGTGDNGASIARFPLIHVAAPLARGWAAGVGYGSLLEQTFAVESSDSLLLGGEREAVTDRFVRRGGVSRLRLAAARRLGDHWSVGLGVDLHTGQVSDSSVRAFGETAGIGVARFGTTASYRGVVPLGGVQWADRRFSVAASAIAPGTLRSSPEPRDTAAGPSFTGAPQREEYSLPLRFAVGASAELASRLSLALGGQFAGWAAADDELRNRGGSQDAFTLGGGLEYEGRGRAEVRRYPVRLGARYARLPFGDPALADFSAVTERALTGGLGAALGRGAARADLALERGSRGADGGVDEGFWRVSLSFTALGR